MSKKKKTSIKERFEPYAGSYTHAYMQHAPCGTGQQRSWTEIILENCKSNCCYTYFFNCFSRVFDVMAMKNYLNIFLCAPCETLFVYFSCGFFFYSVNNANVCFLIKRTKCAAEKKEEKKKPKNNINLIKKKNFSTFIFREVIDNGFRAVGREGWGQLL